MVEFLSGRRSGADTVVNVATTEFRFRAIVLIEKFVLDVAYEKIGVAGVEAVDGPRLNQKQRPVRSGEKWRVFIQLQISAT